LAHGPERYREVAARNAGGEGADRELKTLSRRDPSPAVRISAIERLVELRGTQAIAPVSDALADPEPTVRAAAAQGLGKLGAVAVPDLKRVVEANDPDAARAALAGLTLSGTGESGDALREIAATHPDKKIREIAVMALGGKIDD
jgi:HEAT repeat protein